MIYISHRGNISGRIPDKENTWSYILDAIKCGYSVEIDIWYKDNVLYLGHDEPHDIVDINNLIEYKDKLWIHCKNIDVLHFLNNYKELNIFFHDKDDCVLTSHNYIWTYPGKSLGPRLINKSICVLPETVFKKVLNCCGICSDIIEQYKKIKWYE